MLVARRIIALVAAAVVILAAVKSFGLSAAGVPPLYRAVNSDPAASSRGGDSSLPAYPFTVGTGFRQRPRGVYADPAPPWARRFEGTILVTGANWAYRDILANWECAAGALGLQWVVIAFDQRLYEHLGPERAILVGSHLMEGGHEFRSEGFNIISCGKLAAVHSLLAAGTSAVLSDADNVFVRDPFTPGEELGGMIALGLDYVYTSNIHVEHWWTPDERLPLYFSRAGTPAHHGWSGVDGLLLCATGRMEAEGNTGLHYARASEVMVRVFRDAVAKCEEQPAYDDQANFWSVMNTYQAAGNTRHCSKEYNADGTVTVRTAGSGRWDQFGHEASASDAAATSAAGHGGHGGHGDQGRAAAALISSTDSSSAGAELPPLLACCLDSRTYVSGGRAARNDSSVVAYHANFVTSKPPKIQKLKLDAPAPGLWFLQEPEPPGTAAAAAVVAATAALTCNVRQLNQSLRSWRHSESEEEQRPDLPSEAGESMPLSPIEWRAQRAVASQAGRLVACTCACCSGRGCRAADHGLVFARECSECAGACGANFLACAAPCGRTPGAVCAPRCNAWDGASTSRSVHQTVALLLVLVLMFTHNC